MNKLKRPVFLLLTTGILCATGTAAYFSDFEKKINSAAVGYVTTEIEEDFPDPTPTLWRMVRPTEKRSGSEIFPAV